jgi:hypothetical protein
MSIRQMLPVGSWLRKCPVCSYPISAKSPELTAHELNCLDLEKFTMQTEMQTELFPDLPTPNGDQLHIVAHKCRGEATLEIAIRWDFGTDSDPAPWWILQTIGSRIYPYWIGPKITTPLPPIPLDAREFHSPSPTREREKG